MSEDLDAEKGIQAIIDLQDSVGIVETREKALDGWNKMPQRDKETTMRAHRVCFPDKYVKEG